MSFMYSELPEKNANTSDQRSKVSRTQIKKRDAC